MIDPLTLDQLRILVAVVETGSFSAAARKLGRVQSAVSQSIQTLETTLGVPLFDRSTKTPRVTEAGAALVADARNLIEQAQRLRARAQGIVDGLEPHLALAVDPTLPLPPLIESLGALRQRFPDLPATVYTEPLGGAEELLRSGVARMAFYPLRSGPEPDLAAEFLTRISLAPVVAADHPLAREQGPLPREALEPHIQLVLTGHTEFARNVRGGIISRQLWRFADMNTRLQFLLAGFGWCNMPRHLVSGHVAEGRLKWLEIDNEEAPEFALFAVVQRGRSLGKAGRWLVADLRERLARESHDFPQLQGPMKSPPDSFGAS